jgi:hypothetical protein
MLRGGSVSSSAELQCVHALRIPTSILLHFSGRSAESAALISEFFLLHVRIQPRLCINARSRSPSAGQNGQGVRFHGFRAPGEHLNTPNMECDAQNIRSDSRWSESHCISQCVLHRVPEANQSRGKEVLVPIQLTGAKKQTFANTRQSME